MSRPFPTSAKLPPVRVRNFASFAAPSNPAIKPIYPSDSKRRVDDEAVVLYSKNRVPRAQQGRCTTFTHFPTQTENLRKPPGGDQTGMRNHSKVARVTYPSSESSLSRRSSTELSPPQRQRLPRAPSSPLRYPIYPEPISSSPTGPYISIRSPALGKDYYNATERNLTTVNTNILSNSVELIHDGYHLKGSDVPLSIVEYAGTADEVVAVGNKLQIWCANEDSPTNILVEFWPQDGQPDVTTGGSYQFYGTLQSRGRRDPIVCAFWVVEVMTAEEREVAQQVLGTTKRTLRSMDAELSLPPRDPVIATKSPSSAALAGNLRRSMYG